MCLSVVLVVLTQARVPEVELNALRVGGDRQGFAISTLGSAHDVGHRKQPVRSVASLCRNTTRGAKFARGAHGNAEAHLSNSNVATAESSSSAGDCNAVRLSYPRSPIAPSPVEDQRAIRTDGQADDMTTGVRLFSGGTITPVVIVRK